MVVVFVVVVTNSYADWTLKEREKKNFLFELLNIIFYFFFFCLEFYFQVV